MTDRIEDPGQRPGERTFEQGEGHSKTQFEQFSSAVRNVFPEQFDGDVSVRCTYKSFNRIKDLARLRTSLQGLAILSLVTGLISGVAQLGLNWLGVLSAVQIALTAWSVAAPAVGLASLGWVEFSLTRQIRAEYQRVEQAITQSLTHRTLYFGSAQYSIALGDEGLAIKSNRLSSTIYYWAVDMDQFIQDNNLPDIEILPFRNARLADVKSGLVQGEPFEAFFKAMVLWFKEDASGREHLRVPLITENSLLDPSFEPSDSKTKTNKAAEYVGPTRLKSETLIVPLSPFKSNRDSAINPLEFTICLYFAIRRAHIDRIQMRVLSRSELET
ncbi:hypothetical protein L2D00_06505 [Hyphomonadaceae bacterium BL14]|nr:hypothetical protein L2D00_06505 [Hyphomonadaceae bacterium BL14]